MPAVGFLTSRVDFRKLIGAGFVLVAVSLWLISNLTLEISTLHIALPSVLTGVGLSMIFVPLATVAMGTLPQKEMGNASGVFNLVRNVGGSIGISLLTTYLVRRSQANQTTLASHLTSWNSSFQQRLQETQAYVKSHLGSADTLHRAQHLVYASLLKQSQLLAFVQSFRLLALICLICIALALLLRKISLSGRI
jgi:DHA2 family multidrug resistance protein